LLFAPRPDDGGQGVATACATKNVLGMLAAATIPRTSSSDAPKSFAWSLSPMRTMDRRSTHFPTKRRPVA
jgi:hypothetical protein